MITNQNGAEYDFAFLFESFYYCNRQEAKFNKYTESCFFRLQSDDSMVCVMHLQYQIRSFASTNNSNVVAVGKMAKPIKCFAQIFNSYS